MSDSSASAAALFDAIRKRDDPAIDAALENEPALLRARDGNAGSVVMTALRAGNRKLAERLAGRLETTPDGLDVFDAACLGILGVINTLLETDRADVDGRGADGYTALHHAAEFGQVEAVRLLLGRGADPNAVSMNELRATPLHSAVAAGRRDTAGLLMALGASPNAIEHGGISSLHLAARRGDEAIIDMLLIRGADATRKSEDGKTPADTAQEGGHSALARLLRTSSAR